MNATIQNHLGSRSLEERPASDNDVVTYWIKAIRAFDDARQVGTSQEGRLLRAYDAGRLAALALIRAAGYRPRGAERHHYVTFDAARSIASTRELADALLGIDELRSVRHALEYEPEDEVDAETVTRAIDTARQVINLGAKHLRAARPNAARRIHMVRA
jgi:hypothetical protein